MEGSVTAPDIASLRRMFEDSSSLTVEARKQSRIDQDYYDGNQWTPEERRVLQKRKQPDLVFNRVRPAVNGTLGVIKQGATDPKAYPASPKDEQTADVASKTLRYIADKNRFDALKIDVAKDYLIQGTGAAIIEIDEDRQVTVQQIRWEEFFYDPRSRRRDFQDARYMGVAKWMYADDVAAMYPKAKKDVDASLDGPAMGDDSFEDRPSDGSTSVSWVDKSKRRVMVIELYHREGLEWRRCVFHAGGVLDYGVSQYLDPKGKPSCPIEAQSCFVDRENNRHGIVRDMRGPQDEINKRRSKLLHLVSARQVQSMTGAEAHLALASDKEEVRQEAAKPDGVLPAGWMVVPTTDMASGQAQLLAEAKSEIERMAPSPAMIGRDASSQSGRATLVRQQAGMTELAVIFGGVEDWELRVYRQMWARARQFWTAPMYVRVTDDEGSPEFVQLNEPQLGPPQVVMGPDGMPTLQPTVLGYKNAIGEMDIDIILDTIPDTANVQQEQFQMLAELAKVGALGPNAGQLLLEASSLPNKRAIVEKMEAQAQQPNPQAQLQQAGSEAQVSKTQAEARLTDAKALNEMRKSQVEALEALQGMHAAAAGY